MASLELFKIITNSVLSQRGEHYTTFDIKKFFLGTPLNRPEYVKIWLSAITQEFIEECDLETQTQEVWVYLEIRKGVYGYPRQGN